MTRIADRLRSQNFTDIHCGCCGKLRPVSEPFYAVPKGWAWVLIRSGRNSVWQWRCPECVKGIN